MAKCMLNHLRCNQFGMVNRIVFTRSVFDAYGRNTAFLCTSLQIKRQDMCAWSCIIFVYMLKRQQAKHIFISNQKGSHRKTLILVGISNYIQYIFSDICRKELYPSHYTQALLYLALCQSQLIVVTWHSCTKTLLVNKLSHQHVNQALCSALFHLNWKVTYLYFPDAPNNMKYISTTYYVDHVFVQVWDD